MLKLVLAFLAWLILTTEAAAFRMNTQTGIAPHYGKGDRLHGTKTANGERFNTQAMTAAHKTLSFGTMVRVWHKNKSVIVRINDRGPFIRGRIIDLSYAASRAIGCGGICKVKIEVLERT